MSLALFLLRRFGRLLLTVLLISSAVFVIVRIIPGDPARVIAGIDATVEDVESIRRRLGTNEPLFRQYFSWLGAIVSFDFGDSFVSGQPVNNLIMQRFPTTLLLASAAFCIALLLAVPIGVVSAVHRWSVWDYGGMVFSHVGMAVPSFWLGILLLLLFSARLGWLPFFGSDSVANYVLPAVALGAGRGAVLVRVIRASMSEELRKEYILTATASGLPRRNIVYRHALKNALLPVITIAGIQFGYMLGGAIIIEQVFSLPGLGRLFLSAIYQRDLPLIQGGVVFVAIVFSFTNFLVDLLYGAVNPKIRFT